jgi:hypothetical protein
MHTPDQFNFGLLYGGAEIGSGEGPQFEDDRLKDRAAQERDISSIEAQPLRSAKRKNLTHS